MKAFYNSLSDDGILVMQLGESPEWFSPDETHSTNKNRAAATRLLESVGFESIHAYEEVSASLVFVCV
jgi:spermidine synthase